MVFNDLVKPDVILMLLNVTLAPSASTDAGASAVSMLLSSVLTVILYNTFRLASANPVALNQSPTSSAAKSLPVLIKPSASLPIVITPVIVLSSSTP